MQGYCLLILSILILPLSRLWANDIIDDPTLLYQPPPAANSALYQKITIKRKISDINELVQKLNNLQGIQAQIRTYAANKASPVLVDLDNAPIEDLLDQTSNKLGYNWNYKDSIVIFSAINPVKLLAESVVATNLVPGVSTINNIGTVWNLDTADHTLRGTLTKWCKALGWQLVWNVKADYPLVTNLIIDGSFEQAVNAVLKGTQNTNIPLIATMYDSAKILKVYSLTK